MERSRMKFKEKKEKGLQELWEPHLIAPDNELGRMIREDAIFSRVIASIKQENEDKIKNEQ
jgi:hypothetical protein